MQVRGSGSRRSVARSLTCLTAFNLDQDCEENKVRIYSGIFNELCITSILARIEMRNSNKLKQEKSHLASLAAAAAATHTRPRSPSGRARRPLPRSSFPTDPSSWLKVQAAAAHAFQAQPACLSCLCLPSLLLSLSPLLTQVGDVGRRRGGRSKQEDKPGYISRLKAWK